MKAEKNFYLNGKKVPIFNLEKLLEGYDPFSEPDPWSGIEDDPWPV